VVVARKQALPADRLDRLNERYRWERDALVALTEARTAVEEAARRVDVANDVLAGSRRGEQDAYQQVVALVGAAAAAELSGGLPGGKASRGGRPSRPRGGRVTAAAASTKADHELADDRADGVAGK
jgi:hypothetical protein